MHSDHRRRHHIRPADKIYPGDRITRDAAALAALTADADAALPADVVADAALVLHRTRTAPTRFVFPTSAGPVRLDAAERVVVVQERGDALLDL